MEDNKIRVSTQQGRCGSANHNSRFVKSDKDHIDADRTRTNLVLANIGGTMRRVPTGTNLATIEKDQYKELYGKHLELQNQKYLANRQKKRVRTIDDIYSSPKSAPMELILQIGNKDQIDIIPENIEAFKKMLMDFIEYMKGFSNICILSVALHTDETSIHCHLRYTVFNADRDGFPSPQQDKGLESMGIQLPEPEKKISRFNNRLMTFTHQIRASWFRIIKKHAPELDLEEKPKETKRGHLDKIDYQIFSAEKETCKKEKILKQMEDKIQEYQRIIETQEELLDALEISEGIEREMAVSRNKQRGRGR